MMSAHTPGPWTVKQDGDDYVLEGAPSPISEAYPSGIRGRVFSIRRGVIPMPNDARLIAAAPRMLEVLKAALARFESEPVGVHAHIGAIRAILRDVEGQS